MLARALAAILFMLMLGIAGGAAWAITASIWPGTPHWFAILGTTLAATAAAFGFLPFARLIEGFGRNARPLIIAFSIGMLAEAGLIYALSGGPSDQAVVLDASGGYQTVAELPMRSLPSPALPGEPAPITTSALVYEGSPLSANVASPVALNSLSLEIMNSSDRIIYLNVERYAVQMNGDTFVSLSYTPSLLEPAVGQRVAPKTAIEAPTTANAELDVILTWRIRYGFDRYELVNRLVESYLCHFERGALVSECELLFSGTQPATS